MLVLLYHADLGLSGGYVGVDVFFVISGFLVTGMLRKSITEGTFSFFGFWERRVRRLIPALFVVAMVSAATSYLLLLPESLMDLGASLIAQPLLLANFYFWVAAARGYFLDPPEIRPLLHTWSLGLEEQFYLLAPILLVVLLRARAARRIAPMVLVALMVCSLVACIRATPLRPAMAYFDLRCRAWELLMGGCLSFLPGMALPRYSREVLGWLGLALVALAATTFDQETSFPGTSALAPCLGAAMLLLAEGTTMARLLSWSVAVRVGKISYSLYLWHWVVISATEYVGLMTSIESRLAVLLLSGGLAHLTWRWVESPIRERRLLAQRWHMLVLFLIYAAGCIGIGSLFIHAKGFPDRWSDSALKLAKAHRLGEELSKGDVDPARPELVHYLGAESAPAKMMIWGDSMAGVLVPAFDALGKENGIRVIRATQLGRRGLLAESQTGSRRFGKQELFFANYVLETARREQVKKVILISRWSDIPVPELTARLTSTVRALQDLEIEVVLLTEVPYWPYAAPRLAACHQRWPFLPRPKMEELEHSRQLKKALRSLPGVDMAAFQVLDPAPIIIAWDALEQDGEMLYSDTHHLTQTGALRLKPLFERLFKEEI